VIASSKKVPLNGKSFFFLFAALCFLVHNKERKNSSPKKKPLVLHTHNADTREKENGE
jgi:hypothetical protein